jgi:septum formation topological specificity factor MinE
MKKEYIQKIQAVVMEYVKVDSNSMEFIMKKQDFLKTGLPKSIYKKIKKEMKKNNRFLKENDIKNLETSW